MRHITSQIKTQALLFSALILFCGFLTVHPEPHKSFIYIDTTKRTLSVIKNGRAEAVFENISIGKGGSAKLRQRGDAKTPLGEFKIIWINRNSRYHLFFGLDFPNIDYAVRAYQAKIIDKSELIAIQKAYALKTTPPQETQLGGYIGIHGIGNGDLKTHQSFNWTDGCIALTNEQINQLAKLIGIGTKVIISA